MKTPTQALLEKVNAKLTNIKQRQNARINFFPLSNLPQRRRLIPKGITNARKKMIKKNLDLLVLNVISTQNPAFGADYNQVFFLTREGVRELKRLKKEDIAVLLWDEIYEIGKK